MGDSVAADSHVFRGDTDVLLEPGRVFHEPMGHHGAGVSTTSSGSGPSGPGVRVFRPPGQVMLVLASVVLIFAGIVPLSGCSDRNVELFAACEKGDVDRIKDLLDRGAHVNARNRNGETPLMVAAGLVYPDAVRLLIARGADVNAESSRGETALAVALGARLPDGSPDVESDLDSVVELLVGHGAVR